MAVPKSRRKRSGVEFLDLLYDVENILISVGVRVPGRKTYFYNNFILHHAANALDCAKSANSIYVSCENDFYDRRRLFQKTINEIQSLVTQLDFLYDMNTSKNKPVISDYVVKEVLSKLNSVCQIIRAIMKKENAKHKNNTKLN